MRFDDSFSLEVLKGGECAGVVLYKVKLKEKVGIFKGIGVDEEYKGTGLSKFLAEMAMTHMKAMGVRKVIAQEVVSIEAAVILLKYGFKFRVKGQAHWHKLRKKVMNYERIPTGVDYVLKDIRSFKRNAVCSLRVLRRIVNLLQT